MQTIINLYNDFIYKFAFKIILNTFFKYLALSRIATTAKFLAAIFPRIIKEPRTLCLHAGKMDRIHNWRNKLFVVLMY